MAILTNNQYEALQRASAIELSDAKQKNKLEILSLYYEQVDDLLLVLDKIPEDEYKDVRVFMGNNPEIEGVFGDNQDEMHPQLILGMFGVGMVGAKHAVRPAQISNIGFEIDPSVVDQAVAKVELPFQKDIDILIKAGIYEPRSYSKVDLVQGLSSGGENRYNRMLEKITAIEDRSFANKLIQSLTNYANAGDPMGKAVVGMADTLYGVKPKQSYSLSTAIWGEDKRDAILREIFTGVNENQSRLDIISRVQGYLKDPKTNGGFYKAERVVDTEMQRVYGQAHGKHVQEFNRRGPGPKLLIKQELSPLHNIKDICDELEGVYDPNGYVPDISRHPNCRCIESTVFTFDYDGRKRRLGSGTFTSKIFPKQQVGTYKF